MKKRTIYTGPEALSFPPFAVLPESFFPHPTADTIVSIASVSAIVRFFIFVFSLTFLFFYRSITGNSV